MSYTALYFLMMADKISDTLLILLLVSLLPLVLSFILALIAKLESDEEAFKDCKKILNKSILATFLFTLLFIGIPNTKQIAIIIGLHEVTNNEEVKKLPNNILKLVNSKLEEFSQPNEKTQ